MTMPIYESAEDYLESILMMEEKKGVAHSVDIAEDRGFSKASVSVAMKKLRENGYIEMKHDGSLILLPPGREIATRIYERHKVLTDYFEFLGVYKEVAQKDACKIEHDLSEETFLKFKEDVEKRLYKK